MAAFHAFRAASRLYTLSSSPLSGLRFASSSTGTHRFSPKYPSSKATTSKFPPRKPTLGKEAPESYLNSSTLSQIVLSRQQPLNKRIPLQTPVPKPGSKPGLKPKPKPEPKAVFAAPPYPPRPESRPPPTPPAYKRHREMMKKKFPDGWAPPRTISREAMEILRALHAENPVQYRTPVLANRFKISPEAVSRILKSKWRPSAERISQAIARDNLNRNKWTANKIRMEREEVVKSLKGRLDIAEKARGKDRLTMK